MSDRQTNVPAKPQPLNPLLVILDKLRLSPSKYDNKQKASLHKKFYNLSMDDKQEWLDNMINKCYLGYKMKKFDMLREDLPFICHWAIEQKIPLPQEKLYDLLKKTFLDVQNRYHNMKLFKEAGIDTSDYEVLKFTGEEKSRWGILSCCF